MATEMTKDNNIIKSENNLFDRVASLIENARKKAATTVNSVMVYTYYGVGKYIVEFEQNGKVKADYGKQVLINLSLKLTDKFGEGWSEETLKKCRKFFTVYVEFPTPEKILTASTDSVYGVDQIHNDALVELTLPKDANIYAQQYAVCLPDKKLLQNKLREWIAEYNQQQLSSK